MNLDTPTRAVVVRPYKSWFAAQSGTCSRGTPPWALDDLARLVHAAGNTWFNGEGTILIQPKTTAGKQDKALRATVATALDTARAAGWKVTDTGYDTGWFTFAPPDEREPDRATVHLGIGPWIKQSRTTLFRLDDFADRIALRFALYHDLTGAAWRGTAGLSGCAAIRHLHESKPKGGMPLWRWDRAPQDVVGCSYELKPNKHCRASTMVEGTWVHHFDISAMYLAAADVAELPWSAPKHVGPTLFDPARQGYWAVRREQLPASDVLGLIVADGDSPLVWVTTPVMVYLAELGCMPEVMDAWIGDRSGRILRVWAERLRDARRLAAAVFALSPGATPLDVEPAVKDTYARTIGMMGRAGGRVFRPDWRDLIVDRARINMLRKLRAARVLPLRYNVDSVWIASTDADPAALLVALGAAATIGKFRHVDTSTLDEYREKYEEPA